MTPTPLLDVARSLAPLVEGGALAGERERRLSKAVVEALCGAGIFQVMVPEEVGGHALDPVSAIRVLAEIARQDGSAGWCAATSAVLTGLAAAKLPERALAAVFPDRFAVLAGGLVPRGRARRVEGGYRLSGHHTFGSGIHYATTVVAGAVAVDDAGRPLAAQDGLDILALCVPPETVEVRDNWQVAGLEGTGSCDFVTRDLFVPEDFTFHVSPGTRRGNRLHRQPLLTQAYISHASFALGVGQRALDEARALALGGRTRLASASPLAQRGVFQRELAEAEAAYRAARLLVFDAYQRVWEEGAAGVAELSLRADVAQAVTHAAAVSAKVTDFAFRFAGASSVYRSDVIQRCFRDMHTGRQHIAVGDEVFERVGQVRLGLAGSQVML